ncbi:hypothetical protein MKW98_029333 [Papaver atlanticum]|uniref:Uncharacterized protein n=1 Tax=Papaver atlanticum TaxID=357466 RepID=A0AAD4SJG0_9MAGN|nr:hypothetical protein MKW98_029333 [Papaver atlanticum]
MEESLDNEKFNAFEFNTDDEAVELDSVKCVDKFTSNPTSLYLLSNMDVDVCKSTECEDVEILDVINNKDQKFEVVEVAECQKVEVESDKIKIDVAPKNKLLLNEKAGIRIHESFHALVVEAEGYEKLTFDEIDVRNRLQEDV